MPAWRHAARTVQAEQDIEERKRELAEARVELAHKQEYEAVKKQIMQARLGGTPEPGRNRAAPLPAAPQPPMLPSAAKSVALPRPFPAAQVPARSATLAEQEGARREIADLQQQSASLDALFEARKQQFAAVLASLEQLQRHIDREGPEESVVPLPEGAGGGGGGNGGAVGGSAQPVQQQPMQVG